MATMIRKGLLLLVAMAPGLLTGSAPTRSGDLAQGQRIARYRFAPLGQIAVYRPEGEPRGVVLLLSDRDGWTPSMDQLGEALARRDLLVAGVSTPALQRAMTQAKRLCANPDYPLIDLSRDLQHAAGVARYRKPLLMGVGTGATLAYAGLAQWPNGGFQGAVSINPVGTLNSRKPWCAAPGFSALRSEGPGHETAWKFGVDRRLAVPWVVIGQEPATVGSFTLLRFVSAVPHASLIRLSDNGMSESGAAHLRSRAAATVLALLPPPPPHGAAGDVAIPDMPLTLVPASQIMRADRMAILYSGDGGWVGIDRDLTSQIAAAGIPVVGVDSLSYFWSVRSPQGAGRDLAQLIRAFGRRWNKRKVMLIGYSFGADALPYMIAALDQRTRAQIDSVSLLGLGPSAQFQFHMMSWLDFDSSDALPTLPAIARLKGLTIRCIRGELEKDSACPSIPPWLAEHYVVPGGHHFGRNTPLLAHIVLGQRRPGRISR
ncbi:AcvB/VirJ family lysyl-phosphatidylglycerol hydrolase [Sphingobium sp. AN558]|uniref:AcvB/VirJ family lysyl-phosphatidylglycerol hydrolase n=1 Tax=Sphingobium sp. AN558 TaxID=3133442 RepID=UPI0030BF2C7E